MIYYIGTVPCTSSLKHFGIPGQKWGERRYQNEDGSLTEAGKARYYKQINKEARKDAKKYVNAKQYYGEGAGNRRKLLKGELSKKMKNPDYKAAFDKHVANADYAAATKRAKAERGARDTAKAIKRGAKILAAASAVTVAALGAYNLHQNANKVFDKSDVMDYTMDLLKKNGSKFHYYDDWDLYSKFG